VAGVTPEAHTPELGAGGSAVTAPTGAATEALFLWLCCLGAPLPNPLCSFVHGETRFLRHNLQGGINPCPTNILGIPVPKGNFEAVQSA